LAALVKAGLGLLDGTEISWREILAASIPVSAGMADALAKMREAYAPEKVDEEIDALVTKLDAIVGPALGLSISDIDTIRKHMNDDPFLQRVRPRYPFFRPRQYGRRKNLERKDRYVA